MADTAPTEPLKAAPEALTDRLRRGAQFIESTLGDPVVLWSLESRESLASLLSVAAEALEARDDAAELRAALAEMSDLVYTIRHAEEELENAPLLRDAGRSTAHMREAIENAWERLCELAALHDDTSVLAASEGLS